jgi:hypothetical protein
MIGSLSDAQLRAVMAAAASLRRDLRPAFLRAVMAALRVNDAAIHEAIDEALRFVQVAESA